MTFEVVNANIVANLSAGCVQSIYEDVARDTNRGHTVESVKECFVMAKDAGFKVRWMDGRVSGRVLAMANG